MKRCASSTALVDAIVGSLREELADDLLAVLLTGSMYDGSYQNDSDIDICVLWRRPYSLRRRTEIEVVEIDLFFDNPAGIRRIIRRGHQRFVVWMYAHARALYDPDGEAKCLMAEGAARWAHGRAAPTKGIEFQQRCEITDSLRTIERVADDDLLGFAYLIGPYVATAVEAYWFRVGRWGTHRKNALKQLREDDPDVHALIAQVYDTSADLATRKRAARDLAHAALGESTHRRDLEGSPFRR